VLLAGVVSASALGAAACGPEGPRPLRVWTKNYELRITSDPSPPRAREVTRYRIVVLDRNTRQAIDRGAGQIFAKSADGASVYDAFEPAAEAGTYTARLSFITAGDWRINVRFQREPGPDVGPSLEKPVDDWVQAVRGARPIEERPTQ
jgi:hypothetical protein